MDGDGHVVTDTEDSTESVCTQAQVSVLAHILEALTLLLHGIVTRATSVELQLRSLDLAGLSFALALHELTGGTDARTGSDALEQLLIHRRGVNDNLNVLNGRTVVQGNEVHSLAATMRAHPAFDSHLFSKVGAPQGINHFCSTHDMSLFVDSNILFTNSHYSNMPLRSISTSFSVRKRQSPRRTFFLVSPANCTRSSFTTR